MLKLTLDIFTRFPNCNFLVNLYITLFRLFEIGVYIGRDEVTYGLSEYSAVDLYHADKTPSTLVLITSNKILNYFKSSYCNIRK